MLREGKITESIHMARDDIDRYLDNKSKRRGSVMNCILKCSLAAYIHACIPILVTYLQTTVWSSAVVNRPWLADATGNGISYSSFWRRG
jgi:cytidylate kinase